MTGKEFLEIVAIGVVAFILYGVLIYKLVKNIYNDGKE